MTATASEHGAPSSPSRGTTHGPSDGGAPVGGGIGSGSRYGGWQLRNWRLRTKLLAVLLIPAMAAIALGALRVSDDYDRTQALARTSQQVELSTDAAQVIQALQRERDLTVSYIAAGRSGNRSELDKQRRAVDKAVKGFRDAISAAQEDGSGQVVERFAGAAANLDRINALRTAVDTSEYPAEAALRVYTDSVQSLLSLGQQGITRTGDPELVRLYLATNAIARAKEQESIKRARLASALSVDSFGVGGQRALLAADAELDSALSDFRKWATPAQQQLYNDTVTGLTVDRAHTAEETAIVRSQTEGNLEGLSKSEWLTASTETVNLTQQVAENLRGQLQDRASSLETAARTEMYVAAVLVLGALALAFAIALFIARSLLLPLRTLRRSALDVADNRLPDAVDSILDDETPDVTGRNHIEPIPVHTTEEIGRVARSFDAVHSQALRLASEQALLRNNVNDLFVNLARRSQTLVQRQLSMIEKLEQDEQDPDQLSQLFELDHLATRMRRNNENLLILGGTELTRKMMKPVPLPEVIGAAVSEVEQYARVSIADPPELAVQGRVVNDIVHLIAELLENATVFSNPDTEVTVQTAYRRQELVMEIRDRGVGIDSEEIAEINDRLVRPPDVDVAVSRRMGLYVVGQLGRRHNIVVELQNNTDLQGGVTATVRLPGELIAQLTPNGPMPMPDVPRTGSSEPGLTDTGSHGGLAAAFGGSGPVNGSAPGFGASAAPANEPAPPEPPTERAVPTNGQHYAGEVVPKGGDPDDAPTAGSAPAQPPDSRDDEPSTGAPSTNYSVQLTAGDTYGAADVPHWATEPEPAADTENEDRSAADAEAFQGQCGVPPGVDGPGALFQNPLEEQKTAQFERPSYDAAAPDARGGPAPLSNGAPGEEPAAQTQSKGPAHDMDDAPTERLPIYEAVLSQWFRAADDPEDDGAAGSSAFAPGPDLEADDQLVSSADWGGANGYGGSGTSGMGSGGSGIGSHGTAAGAVGGRERARREQARGEAAAQEASTPGPASESTQGGTGRDPGWGAGDEGWQAAEALVEKSQQEQEITPAGLPKRRPKSNLVPGSAAKPQSPAPEKPAAPRSPDAVRGRMSNFQQGVQRGRHAKVEPDEPEQTEQSRSIPSRPEEQE